MTRATAYLCPCRVGAGLGVVAVACAFVVRATNHPVEVVAMVLFCLAAPVGLALGLRGCGRREPVDDPDDTAFLTERTIAHTGVALSVLSLVVFVI